MAKQAKNEEKQILLRVPMKIFKEVKARAESMQRSVNGQIVYELDSRPK